MNDRFALPGFQTPAAVKEQARAFGEVNTPFEVVFLTQAPLEEPLRHFDFYISQDSGGEISLLAYSKTNHYVFVRPNPVQGKDYLVRILPDELSILPGVFTLRVMENDREIFRKIVNVGGRPIPSC